MSVLRLVHGPGAPSAFSLQALDNARGRFKLWLGRDRDFCQIHLAHPCISRRHAYLTIRDGQLALVDANSRSGTRLNGLALEPGVAYPVRHHDRIDICCCAFRVCHPQDETDSAVGAPELAVDVAQSNGAAAELEDSTIGWLAANNTLAAERLRAVAKLARELRRRMTIDELRPRALKGLLSLFDRADRAVVALHATPPCPPLSICALERGAAQMIELPCVHRLTEDTMKTRQAMIDDQGQCIAAPLQDMEGHILGAIQVEAFYREHSFDREDLRLLDAVDFQISIVVENAILHDRILKERVLDVELQMARELQLLLLPHESPTVAGYEFFDYYMPARSVGGDYFDYVALNDDQTALIVGDVSGKGVPAAMLMVKIASEIGASLDLEQNPVKVLSQVNQRFARRSLDGAFVTLVLAILDSKSHTLSIANAGHLRPLLRRIDGSVAEIGDAEAGMPLGIDPSQRYVKTTIDLWTGDTLVLVSDGITEAQNKERSQYGYGRLIDVLRSADGTAIETGRRIVADVDKFVHGHAQSDDRCLMCIRRAA